METYTVIGAQRVGGVEPGGTIELDPDRVNIEALVRGGHVERVRPAPKPAAKKAEPKSRKGDDEDTVEAGEG